MNREKSILLTCIISIFFISLASAQENLVINGNSFAKVEGDWKRFREDNWMDRNFTTGLEEFYLDKYFEGGRHLIMETSGMSDNDYNLALDFSKEEFGYLRVNYDAFRKYYDDSGDYFAFPRATIVPFWYNLDKNLHADRSNTSIEFGLTLPEQPKYILGYERRSRNGEASLLTRGFAVDTNGAATDVVKTIYPWSKDINWATDTFKVGTEFAIKGINIALNQQYQQFTDDQYSDNINELRDNTFSPVQQRIKTEDEPTSQSITTNFTADKKVNDSLRMKLGYCLNKSSNRAESRAQAYGANGTVSNTFLYSQGEANSDVGAQAINWGMNLKILDSLAFRGALRYRIADISSFSQYSRNDGTNTTAIHDQNSDIGESNTAESIGLTYKGIPRTTVYAEGNAEQSKVNYSMFGKEYNNRAALNRSTNLVWQSKVLYFKENYKCGINTRPFKPLFISAYYKRKTKNNNYEDEVDNREHNQHADGAGIKSSFEYPGYIGENTRLTDEYSLRANITPVKFASFSLKYQEVHTAYNVVKEQYEEIGSLDERTASAMVVITPTEKLYFSTLYSRDEMMLKTPAADSNVANTARDEPTLNNSSSIISSVNYVLNAKTTLSGQYQTWTSEADTNSKSAYASIERELIKNILLKVGYSYYLYGEKNPNADVNDYKAHVGSVSLTGKF